MKPKLLLRIAALLMFVHVIGHTLGTLGWKKAPNAAIAKTIAAMQNNHFVFMGKQATLASYYEGYGLTMIFVLLLIALLLWMLGDNAENWFAGRMLLPITLFLLIMATLEYIYFFPFAAAFTFISGICALFALVRIRTIRHPR